MSYDCYRFAFNYIKYEVQNCRTFHINQTNFLYVTSFLSKRRKTAEERVGIL